MNDWGSGYITDIAYHPGYYPQQSPWHLAMCATLSGVQADMPGSDDPLSYLELGCGVGFGALLLAAANPTWRVTAIDFNPAHIAIARRMAAEAGLTNAVFLEADLSTLAEDPAMANIPEADVVTLHGVWSWVAPSVQAGIVRLLKARVRPGGIVQVSYNSLPAWQGGLGLQRLVREVGRRVPVRSDRQATEGLAVTQALFDTEAKHLRFSPIAAGMMEKFAMMSGDYLAHELMNNAWTPCFHADVAEAMAGARLDWIGSSAITENFPELMLDEAQRAVQARHEDPLMRELIKDMCLERGLRTDIFVRGAVRISPAARDVALGGLTIGLIVKPENFVYEMELPVGKVSMNQDFYTAVVTVLGRGPMRLGDLVALPDLAGHSRNPAELAGMLIGSGQAEMVSRPRAGGGAAARRMNAISARSYVDTSRLGQSYGVASTQLGGGLRCNALELFLLDRIAAVGGLIDPAPWVAELGPNLPPEQAVRLREIMTKLIDERLPAWQLAGLA